MLNLAKKEIKNKNVVFIKSLAQKIDEVISEKVDRIICNGAFWLINKPETLKAMANILKDDGKLVFNMPGQIFKFDEKNKQKLILSSLSQIMTEIAVKKYGLDFNKFSNKLTRASHDFSSFKKSIKDFLSLNLLKSASTKEVWEKYMNFRKYRL